MKLWSCEVGIEEICKIKDLATIRYARAWKCIGMFSMTLNEVGND